MITSHEAIITCYADDIVLLVSAEKWNDAVT